MKLHISNGPGPKITAPRSSGSLTDSLSKSRLLLVAVLGIVYAYLFHQAEVGLNVLLFDCFLLLFFLRTETDLKSRPLFIIAAAGLLFSAISVVIVNTWLASASHICSLLFTIGVVRVREIRFIWFGFLLGVFSFFRTPLDLLKHWRDRAKNRQEDGNFKLRYVLVPSLIVLPFLLIYALANPAIGRLLSQLVHLSQPASFWTIVTMLWGSFIGFIFLYPQYGESTFAKIEADFSDDIPRRQQDKNRILPPFSRPKMLGLKYEYALAKGTFLALNLLLLLVNLIDIAGVWFGNESRSAAELSQFVHTGTYLLIASILLAMLVVIIYFRGLLNFYPRVAQLRKLAFYWIGQNALLALSVGIRNGQYIGEFGLAWGRVQVFFFLALILFGLFTLYRKVDRRLSLTYLLHNNGMAIWLCFLVLASVNWDGIITRYNLANVPADRLDRQHLLSYELPNNASLLADRETLTQLLYPNNDKVSGQLLWQNRPYKMAPNSYRYHDWRSWNYADWRSKQRLEHFRQELSGK